MSSGMSATGTAWSNCATAMRYSGVSHSSGAWASASGGLATARRVYPRAPQRACETPERRGHEAYAPDAGGGSRTHTSREGTPAFKAGASHRFRHPGGRSVGGRCRRPGYASSLWTAAALRRIAGRALRPLAPRSARADHARRRAAVRTTRRLPTPLRSSSEWSPRRTRPARSPILSRRVSRRSTSTSSSSRLATSRSIRIRRR